MASLVNFSPTIEQGTGGAGSSCHLHLPHPCKRQVTGEIDLGLVLLHHRELVVLVVSPAEHLSLVCNIEGALRLVRAGNLNSSILKAQS